MVQEILTLILYAKRMIRYRKIAFFQSTKVSTFNMELHEAIYSLSDALELVWVTIVTWSIKDYCDDVPDRG